MSEQKVLVVEFLIKTAFIADFDSAIRENARLSEQLEPGCRRFDVCRDPGDDALFYLYEIYDCDSAIQVHLLTSHYLEMSRRTADWVISKKVRRLSLHR